MHRKGVVAVISMERRIVSGADQFEPARGLGLILVT